ncbi:MAG: class I SAM-dependent DNA methyltransferase [Saprospiraceae bacterium]
MNHRIHNQVVNFIWGIADDVLRDNIKRGKWADVILPFTVLRRLDALLAPTKQKVLDMIVFLESQGITENTSLTGVTKYPFYNTSRYTFENLLNDPDNIDANLEEYLDGFSKNVREIITKFRVRNYLGTLKDAGLTYMLLQKFSSREINLSPLEATNPKGEVLPPLTNHGMGFVFEELVRKFSEDNNEEAGQHFTPREVIKLMTNLIFLPVKNELSKGNFLVYDPCCGSGGMLTEAEQFAETLTNGKVDFELYGQESEPEIYAICTADMLIKGDDPENIVHGSTLSNDGFPHTRFDFMMSNPPYGKSWKIDQDAIIDGKKKEIKDSRFTMGVPRVSDGQLLFLVHMLSKMKHDSKLGSRIASVHNGSALFTGDAGGGESEIRKWMIESDWVECISS